MIFPIHPLTGIRGLDGKNLRACLFILERSIAEGMTGMDARRDLGGGGTDPPDIISIV